MPTHDYLCPQGHESELFCTIAELGFDQLCHCGMVTKRVYRKFPGMFVQMDIHYDSPIDGRPITSKQARIEDLKRNQCREYDPTEKDEVLRNKAKEEARLDKALDDSVDSTLASWSPRKKELLEQEIRAGADTEITRKSPNGS